MRRLAAVGALVALVTVAASFISPRPSSHSTVVAVESSAAMSLAFATLPDLFAGSEEWPTSCGGSGKRRCVCMTYTCEFCDQYCVDVETCDEVVPIPTITCETHAGGTAQLVCDCIIF